MKTIDEYKEIKKRALENDEEIQYLLEFFERLPLGELRTSHIHVARWAMRYGFQVEMVTSAANEWRITIPD
jgi:hypothetical protein